MSHSSATDVSTQGGLNDLYDSITDWIRDGVHIGEERVSEALALLKGAVSGNNPFQGEDVRLKAKYGADSAAQKAYGAQNKASASASHVIESMSKSADSMYSKATESARVLAKSAEASASSVADQAVSDDRPLRLLKRWLTCVTKVVVRRQCGQPGFRFCCQCHTCGFQASACLGHFGIELCLSSLLQHRFKRILQGSTGEFFGILGGFLSVLICEWCVFDFAAV